MAKTTPVPSQHPNEQLQEAVDANETASASLPGAERFDGEMNWLGSSFSGVDIKVVAHLYGAVDADKDEAELSADLNYQETLASSARAVQNALLSIPAAQLVISTPSQTLFDAANLDPADPMQARVINTLNVAYQVTTRPPNLETYRGQLMMKMDTVADIAEGNAKALREKLQNRQAIRKASSTTIVLATLQTMSLQTHREKYAVRGLGNSYAKGYTRGPRTIAGSMIFTVFNEHALARLIRAMSGKGSVYGERDSELSSLIADQLPPIDLTIVIANEYGQLSQMGLYGVEFVNDGITMSVEDILTEEVCQFVARDCDMLTSRGNVRLSRLQRGMHFNDEGTQDTTGTSLLFTSREAYNAYLDKLKVRRRLLNR